MDILNCAPDGASVRSRSPSRSLEVAPQLPPTTPIRVTESQELVMTPDVVTPVDTSCPGCLAPTRRLKHTCTKARSENKRHTSPSVDSRHAKRSGTGSAPALTATEAVQIPGSSLAIDFGSDVGVRAGEMHVLSEAPSHISSSSLAPAPSHMPVPTPTLEQGEATEVDGDVVMAEGDAFARDTRIANQAVDGLAPRACQHEVVPPPSPARVPSAEENDHLFLPPEGSFVCVALQDGVLPPELHVFTNIGTCIVVTRVEAVRLPVEARDMEPSWSCATCKHGPYAQARALACVHCLTCAPMAADALLRLKEERRHQGCACPAPPPSHRAAAHPAPDELISRRLCTGVALTSENVSRFPQGVARPQAASQDDSGPSTGIGQSCARTRTV